MKFERVGGEAGAVEAGQTVILVLDIIFPPGLAMIFAIDFISSDFYAKAFPVKMSTIHLGSGLSFNANSQTTFKREL